jgi:hypothetical protein
MLDADGVTVTVGTILFTVNVIAGEVDARKLLSPLYVAVNV